MEMFLCILCFVLSSSRAQLPFNTSQNFLSNGQFQQGPFQQGPFQPGIGGQLQGGFGQQQPSLFLQNQNSLQRLTFLKNLDKIDWSQIDRREEEGTDFIL